MPLRDDRRYLAIAAEMSREFAGLRASPGRQAEHGARVAERRARLVGQHIQLAHRVLAEAQQRQPEAIPAHEPGLENTLVSLQVEQATAADSVGEEIAEDIAAEQRGYLDSR